LKVKKEITRSTKIVIGIIVNMLILLNLNIYQAKAVVLESRSTGSAYTTTFNNQFKLIREMEATRRNVRVKFYN
jgi:hypothetical protein